MMPAVIAECVGGPLDGTKLPPPNAANPKFWLEHCQLHTHAGSPVFWYKLRTNAEGKAVQAEIDGQRHVFYDYEPNHQTAADEIRL
jgi:hypothetical protein